MRILMCSTSSKLECISYNFLKYFGNFIFNNIYPYYGYNIVIEFR